MGTVLYLLALALLVAWTFLAPRMRLRWLFLLWGLGLLANRVLPGVLVETMPLGDGEDAPPPFLIEIVIALGAMLQLRALIGFTRWGRPWTRRTRIFAALFALGLVSTGFSSPGLGLLLAIPWLCSFRWRHNLSAGGLALVSLGAFASLFFEVIQFQAILLDHARLPGLLRFHRFINLTGAFYSLLTILATASRVHLSIQRIRLRLLGSHLLAGVVPFALAVLFLMLSGALHLSTYRGSMGARSFVRASHQAEEKLRRAVGSDPLLDVDPFGESGKGTILVARWGGGEVVTRGGPVAFDPVSLIDQKIPARETPLLWDGAALYLRARVDTVIGGVPVEVEALSRVDSLWMVEVSDIVGTPVRISPSLRVETRSSGVQIGGGSEQDTVRAGSIGPRRAGGWQLPGGAIISMLHRTNEGWEPVTVAISSSAGLAEPLIALFTIARENPIATVALVVLGVLALFFLGAIWLTVSMVTQMSKSITRVVDQLTRAARALGEGKLEHRIAIGGNDELWSVAASFNQMAEGLERMRVRERETQRMEEELRLAHEIQQRLLPAEPPYCRGLEMAGVSVPARHVGGDYFDYLALDRGLVGLAVADVSGKGAPAALLMSSFRASFRTQDLATLGPAEVLARLNRFVHASVDPGKFITAFLGLIDPETGEFRYANAGHDPPLLVRQDGTVEELTGGGLILGMLPQIAYEEASTRLELGSLVAVYTDGVTEAQNPEGEFFGSDRLVGSLRAVRAQSCAEGVEQIMGDVRSFAATSAQFDDITMILARRR
jgi:serine phosphatase RsbU (regulator of sigma subunit)